MQHYASGVLPARPAHFSETAPRPPVPGEEDAPHPDVMATTTRSIGSHRGHLAVAAAAPPMRPVDATPRRSNLDRSAAGRDGGADDAPLGFEPEGSATGSPPFTEQGTPPCCRWARSLKQLLADRDGVRLFKQFLDQEQCAATLDFWFACNGLKIVPAADSARIRSLVRLIYKKYVKSGQVSLRADVRRAIADHVRQGPVTQALFNEAQRDIEATMRSESYALFLKSDLYLQYVQAECDSPKSTASGGTAVTAVEVVPPAPAPGPGGLPTLHEGEELKGEDIERSSAAAPLALTPSALMATRRQRESLSFKKPEGVFAVPGSRVPNPYHVSYAPVSAQDSELQSSSDALTDDTMSLTDSSVDGRGDIPFGSKKWYKHRRAVRQNADLNRRTDLNQHLIPRTQRGAAKDHDLAEREPKRFASMLVERLQRVKNDVENLARVEHSIKAIEMRPDSDLAASLAVPPQPPCVQPAAGVSSSSLPLGALIATALEAGVREEEEENAQSILEEHVSRVWDRSVGQTPSRSPPAARLDPPDYRPAYLSVARPSPNVSATSFASLGCGGGGGGGGLGAAGPARAKRKERGGDGACGIGGIGGVLSTSYDERLSAGDVRQHKHVHHHHYHHHQGAVPRGGAGALRVGLREGEAGGTGKAPPPPPLPYCVSSPALPSYTLGGAWGDERVRGGSGGGGGGAKRNAPPAPVGNTSLVGVPMTAAKKASGSSSNKDSGIGMLYDLVPNLHDPVNEKVLAWMKENDHVSTGTAQYSTDNSDKCSSHKHSSHKQSSSSASSSKKPSSHGNRSTSLDRSFSARHQGAQPPQLPLAAVASCYGQQVSPAVLPTQPFAQDPLMPLLAPPHPTAQLEEARRRLQDDANTKARILKSKSLTPSSSSRRSMPPPQTAFVGGHSRPAPSNIPQVAPLDLSSSEEHSSGSVKSERRSTSSASRRPSDVTVVGYYFCGEPIPYRSTVPGRRITLAQFKQLITKKGNYRYFFKKACDEFDSGVVQEEVTADDAVLPMWEGKVVCKVERIE